MESLLFASAPSFELYHWAVMIVFIIGYVLIVFENHIHVNKSAVALVTAVICWACLIAGSPDSIDGLGMLKHHLSSISEVVFFIMGAMTIVELIDTHNGFNIITSRIHTTSRIKMMWIIGFVTFFLSSVLDNLTTTIVMISLIRKIMSEKKDRWIIGSMVVIAANAGGAWTAMGDVTTTMLWIGGQITALNIMKSLFLPSFVLLLSSLLIQTLIFSRSNDPMKVKAHVKAEVQPWGGLICVVGIGFLIIVPVLKALIHFPPYMGMLTGLGALWVLTDVLHGHDERRLHLKTPAILAKIDISCVLFFLGILLSVSALESAGLLDQLALYANQIFPGEASIATVIGLASSVVDNVPLVAACMGMYDLATYGPDHPFWHMIAYTAGTGGSILIIGSAAGVALMGMEKVDFFWYVKYVTFTALFGYFVGFWFYLYFGL